MARRPSTFHQSPHERLERSLRSIESAYAGVYVLIPIALVIHLTFAPQPNHDKFWAVVLVTDFICFAVLPGYRRVRHARSKRAPVRACVQPAHARRDEYPGQPGSQAATLPEGLAAALLVTAAPRAIVLPMFAAALAVAAGAVLGRYHYLVDAIAGWIVAVLVFVAIGA